MLRTDWAIKQAISGIITAVDTTGAVVLPKFVLDFMTGENPNIMRAASGADSGKIHGWMIDRGKQQNVRKSPVTRTEYTDESSYRIDSAIDYRIWFLHWYANGDEGAGTDSTKLFNERLDAVIEAFAKKP